MRIGGESGVRGGRARDDWHGALIALHDATHATAGEGAILATPARPANTHSVGTDGLAAPANSDATQPYMP